MSKKKGSKGAEDGEDFLAAKIKELEISDAYETIKDKHIKAAKLWCMEIPIIDYTVMSTGESFGREVVKLLKSKGLNVKARYKGGKYD